MTMNEYIERKIATNVIGNIDTSHPYDDKDDIVEQAIGLIDHIPAADVEPVRHGRWETAYVEDWDGTMVYEHYHRDCDYVSRNYLTHGSPYCPNCGAKMDL